MEILGIGTDIIECLRIGRLIEKHGEQFLMRIYTPREVRFCQARKRPMEHFASHWAAKEAVLKCLGTSGQPGVAWTDIEVLNETGGNLRVILRGAVGDLARQRGIGTVLLSMSHCRAYATAFATALRG